MRRCTDVSAYVPQKDRNRPIVFVVHSLGGIIVKQARSFPPLTLPNRDETGALLTPKVIFGFPPQALKKASDVGKNKGPNQADALDISNSTKGIVSSSPSSGSRQKPRYLLTKQTGLLRHPAPWRRRRKLGKGRRRRCFHLSPPT